MRTVCAALLLLACDGGGDKATPDGADGDADTDADTDSDTDADTDSDQDGDGYSPPDDCDDGDEEVNPGETEVFYDGVDADCSGGSDYDADADGQDSDDHGGTDCDDLDPAVYDLAPAVACDGRDNDCTAGLDEAPGVLLDGVPVADLPTALGAAATGSTIEVCEGTYAVNGVITSGLTLRGLGGSALVVLDGGATTSVLAVQTVDPVLLEGLTLTNGLGQGPMLAGGGLFVGDLATVDATDLRVEANLGGRGAGISAGLDATLSLVDSAVTGNLADEALVPLAQGGGLALGAGTTLALTTTSIDGNEAGDCGGALLGQDVVVTGDVVSSFDANTATTDGVGGVCARDGGASLVDLDVTNNVGGPGGGAGGIDGVDFTLDGVRVAANTSTANGAGIVASGTVQLDACFVSANTTAGSGGGIAAFGAGTRVTLVDGFVIANVSDGAGAGGALVALDAVLESVNTDWGIGATENLPDDLVLGTTGEAFDWSVGASFVCTDGPTGTCL